MRNIKVLCVVLTGMLCLYAKTFGDEPPEVFLWTQGAPHSEGKTAEPSVKMTASGERVLTGVHKPSLTLFVPDSKGCYIGQWLAERGIAGFVMANRLAREAGQPTKVSLRR